MAKELPYFRFTVAEWMNDDIGLESYHLQGVFISVCSFYWFRDCSVTQATLKKRFSDAQEELNHLLDLGIIKERENDFICIKFLDEQYDKLSKERKNKVDSGRKGGLKSSKQRLSNGQATLKQRSSYKDKDKDKELFKQFWKLYDKKKDKKKCLQKWNLLSDSDIQAILQHLPKYIKATPDKQFRKDPATYLNNRSWEDEYLPETQEQSSEAPMY